jgi:hypothetical protein
MKNGTDSKKRKNGRSPNPILSLPVPEQYQKAQGEASDSETLPEKGA